MEEKHKLNDKYNPQDFERKLYQKWEEKGYFKPSEDKTKKPFTIMMPPPNVTGKLHMGHALDDTIQDILTRYKRMAGFNTLWVPGTDHASIATEAKVVEKLKQEGTSKEELGREKFLERTWEWTHEYGGTIVEQQKRLGCSCDWEHSSFTMDEKLSKAVKEAFIRLYEKGVIYKGKRMINWCSTCHTSISDVEVEYEEESTHLWHIKYPVKNSEEYIVVATTRPETMLGDTGVAVHPEDERYAHLIGKKIILPIVGREIPIIADPFVEKEFGSGAVKLTPCHDMNDYKAGIANHLEMIEVFDENGKMGDVVPEYKGMELLEAREKIVEKLKELGVLLKIEDYVHNVGKCYRCHHTIEPKISEQWFVKMEELAKPAIEAVRKKEIRFIPERYEKTYFHWMENIQDWCISRQIWWGHRIPAYYCEKCGEVHVERQLPEVCRKCGSTKLVQEEDTLDTWFSSALWPFSTLGWPEQTEDFNYYYPTNVMVTGYDIIFFWIARMIFSGIEHTGKKPFSDIVIHGIVRDSQGRKMSKSLGNGIDPNEIIEEYGADPLRFALLLGVTAGNDIRYLPEKLESARNFANKIWNAGKFITMNLPKEEELIEFKERNYDEKNAQWKENALRIEDKWIVRKLAITIEEVTKNIENYDLGIAIEKIYNFIWNEFCDWYIEMAKTRLYSEKQEDKIQVAYVLNHVFAESLKMLHPFMPFITSEIYDKLVKDDEKEVMLTKWPENNGITDGFKVEEKLIENLKAVISEIRNIRANRNIHPSKKAKLIIVTKNAIIKQKLEEAKEVIQKLGFAEEFVLQEEKVNIPNNATSILAEEMEVFIPFEDLIDMKEEMKRLEEEKQKLEKEVERASKMLANPGFVSKAPQEKIKQEEEKLEKYKQMLEATKTRIESLNH